MPKPKKYERAIVWFWNNLRVHDNRALFQAMQEAKSVVGIYIFHTKDWQETAWGFPKTGPFRAVFLRQALLELQHRLDQLNVPLYFLEADASKLLVQLRQQHYPFEAVYYQHEWTQEEITIIEQLQRALPLVYWHAFYDQLLYSPEQINPLFSSLPDVFTDFRKKVEKFARVEPALRHPVSQASRPGLPLPASLPKWFESIHSEVHPNSAFKLSGGESAALERLDDYLFRRRLIDHYKQTRDGLIGADYSSKLSPYLANGSLSVRWVYATLRRYEQQYGANDSTYWLFFELLWREYFKYVSMKYGNLLFARSGFRQQRQSWSASITHFERWRLGQTGQPFIDANMRELLLTGWMSNRGRQNVASWLAKHWRIDWRMGAAWFESQLIDYDVHSNYGNWQYVAGVGNDPRDRLFNPQTQASKYDPKGTYQRLWLQNTLFYG